MIGLVYKKKRRRREWRATVSRGLRAASLAAYAALFFWAANPYTDGALSPSELVSGREFLPRDLFLMLDPLASVAAAIAGRVLVFALLPAGAMLAAAVVWPRFFCSSLCPLGALIDVTDLALYPARRLVGRRDMRRLKAAKYFLLGGVMVAAVLGVGLAGHFAAIPTLTRGFALLLHPLDISLRQDPSLVPALGGAAIAAGGVLASILLLGALKRRFWCTDLCPTGAMMSLVSPLRLRERQVSGKCTGCGMCLKDCAFGAIRDDFSTVHVDCTLCGSCSEICPVDAISFGPRVAEDRGPVAPPGPWSPEMSRRGFVAGGAAGLAGAVAVGRSAWALTASRRFIRPPGAVPEAKFLDLCVRCGNCYRSCPWQMLQPLELNDGGLAGFWTPRAVPGFAGCDPECNNCGTACPTGAIADLALVEKRCAKMGTAEVEGTTCLPHAGLSECGICYDSCQAAGYKAIALVRKKAESGTSYLAPQVDSALCVGCGICERDCKGAYVEGDGSLEEAAIVITPDGEARLMPPESHIAGKQWRIAQRDAIRRGDATSAPPASAP